MTEAPAGLRTVAALHLADVSGPARTLAPVLRWLATRGEVVVAVPGEGTATDELAGIGPVEHVGHEPLVLPRTPGEALALPARVRRDVRRFRALLRRRRADLVVVATRTLPAVTLAARLEGVPAIVYVTELYSLGRRSDPARGLAWRRLMHANAMLASAIVTPTRTVAEGVPGRTPTVVAPPSIDPAIARGEGDELLRRIGGDRNGPVLATLGNVNRERGQDLAVRALALVRRTRPDVRLLIAGAPHPRRADREFAAGLEPLADRLGVADAVHLVGRQWPGDVFAAADVFVNPARFAETFGRAAVEALVAGRPVVSTKVGAVPEVLRDGQDALLVPPDRPEAIAAAVDRLLGDPDLAQRLAEAGRRRALETFTEERQIERFAAAVAIATLSRA